MKPTITLSNHFHKQEYALCLIGAETRTFLYPYYALLLEFLNLDLTSTNALPLSSEGLRALLYANISNTDPSEELDLTSLQALQNSCIQSLTERQITMELLPPDSITQQYQFTIDSHTGIPYPVYEISGIREYLVLEFLHLFVQNKLPKQCKNCSRYFFPAARSDEKYCDYLNEQHRTCKQIGYANTIKQKNPFQFEYRKAYKTQYARIGYFPHIENYKELYFDTWNKEAQSAKIQFEANNDFEGFLKWIQESHRRFHPVIDSKEKPEETAS